MRWAIRTARPAGVFARCRSSRIWPLRLAKTLSITSREEARARSRPMLAAVRVFGCEQDGAAGGEPLAIGASPEAFVGDHDLAEVPVRRSASGSYSFSLAGTIV